MRAYKKKFKVYGWTTIYKDKQSLNWGVFFLPSIDFMYRHDDVPRRGEDGASESYWITLLFSWLIFGVTFDWRKEWEE